MAEKTVIITQNEFAVKGSLKGLQKVTKETLIKVAAHAKVLAPRDKGQLANSYMWILDNEEGAFNDGSGEKETRKLTVKSKPLVGYVGTNSDHWYPEFGTRTQVAQPSLRPAVEIVTGGNAEAIGKKYGRIAMEEEYKRRKVTKREL